MSSSPLSGESPAPRQGASSPLHDGARPPRRPAIGRRRFLAGAVALAAADIGAPFVRRTAAAPLSGNPFALGVASGYPLATGVVLWTRLAPAPLLPGGGMPRDVVSVDWEVATDDRMSHVVQRGVAAAAPDEAHSLHVE